MTFIALSTFQQVNLPLTASLIVMLFESEEPRFPHVFHVTKRTKTLPSHRPHSLTRTKILTYLWEELHQIPTVTGHWLTWSHTLKSARTLASSYASGYTLHNTLLDLHTSRKVLPTAKVRSPVTNSMAGIFISSLFNRGRRARKNLGF